MCAILRPCRRYRQVRASLQMPGQLQALSGPAGKLPGDHLSISPDARKVDTEFYLLTQRLSARPYNAGGRIGFFMASRRAVRGH